MYFSRPLLVARIKFSPVATSSKQNIFDPLGLKSSFKLNAETNKKLIDLNFRNANGSVSPWDNRAGLIQRYPEEGGCLASITICIG